jgi:predicted PolB exonuclease-like 3'-5' exonuclease
MLYHIILMTYLLYFKKYKVGHYILEESRITLLSLNKQQQEQLQQAEDHASASALSASSSP